MATAFDGIDDAFGHWLAGFIDGEGCFVIAPHGTPRSEYVRFKPGFVLKLRDDDTAILQEIVDRTGIGKVHLLAPRANASLREMPQACWSVVSKADCATLARLLERCPLRAKKARDYAIWREAVAEWGCVSVRGQRRHDWSRMAKLKEALETGRRYSEQITDVAAEVAIFESEQLSLGVS